jgi:hypothetical protein
MLNRLPRRKNQSILNRTDMTPSNRIESPFGSVDRSIGSPNGDVDRLGRLGSMRSGRRLGI